MIQESFPKTWAARILTAPPLIAPALQYVYPQHIPGEEDAMNRGALLLDVKPAAAANFLATCALGFREISLPTAIFACPHPDHLLAVAGGYAYVIDTLAPDHCVHLPLRPVTQILSAPSAGLILLAGFHNVLALDANGIRWQSERLSWEGISLTHTDAHHLHGTGWNLHADRDVPFTVNLLTGEHEGGGFII
jgi:hypothetical protein